MPAMPLLLLLLLPFALPSKARPNNAVPESRQEADPRNSTGARGVERSETRMPGALSLWLLSLCARKEKVTRRKGERVIHIKSRCGVR